MFNIEYLKPIAMGVIIAVLLAGVYGIMENRFMNPSTNNQGGTNNGNLYVKPTSENNYTISLSALGSGNVYAFEDWNGILNYIEFYGKIFHTYIYRSPFMYTLLAGEAAEYEFNTATVKTVTSTGTSQGFSSTNVQVSGLDEEDYVKTNGKFIAVIDRKCMISLFNPQPPGAPTKIYEKDLRPIIKNYEGEVTPYLAVVENSTEKGWIPTDIVGKVELQWCRAEGIYLDSNKIIAIVEAHYGVEGWLELGVKTWVVVLSADGDVISKFWVDGSFQASRLALEENKLVIITTKSSRTPLGGAPSRLETSQGLVDPKDVYLMGLPEVYIVVSNIDLVNNKMTTAAVLGSGRPTVYMPANDELYIFSNMLPRFIIYLERLTGMGYLEQDNGKVYLNLSKVNSTDPSMIDPDLRSSLLMKFTVDSNSITVEATTYVNGTMEKQWQMDEYEGYLRIVVYNPANQSVDLHIYNATTLEEVSNLTGIAVNERVYGIRFVANKLYLVTYRVIDPLFLVDLSDPLIPKIVGFIEGPGFDDYLHPLGNSTLIGIGDDGKRNARVTIYKVLSNGSIKVMNRVIIEEYYSQILEDPAGHRAFLYYPSYNYIVIPVYSGWYWTGKGLYSGIAVIKVNTTSGILKLKKVFTVPVKDFEHIHMTRALYIGNLLYLVIPGETQPITVLEASTLEPIK